MQLTIPIKESPDSPENLQLRLAQTENRLDDAEGLLTKATAVIDDMRMVDRWNSRVDFDVEELLQDLKAFLAALEKP